MASENEKKKIVKKAVVKKKVVKKPVVKNNYKELSVKAIELIRYEGISMKDACKAVKLDRKYFYDELDECIELRNKYARACEIRCDLIADEILELATNERETIERKRGFDDIKGNYNETTRKDNIARTKLEIDARKWLLSKMMPKKYGNVKEEKESEADKVPAHITVEVVAPKHNIDDITPDKY